MNDVELASYLADRRAINARESEQKLSNGLELYLREELARRAREDFEMPETEKIDRVIGILRAADVPERSIAWMAPSCPGVWTARAMYLPETMPCGPVDARLLAQLVQADRRGDRELVEQLTAEISAKREA